MRVRGRSLRRLLLPFAGAATVCAAIVVAYHRALPQIWHGVFVTHTRILGSTTAVSNVHRAATYVDPRTPFGCLVIGGALASLVLAVRGRDRRLLGALWLWSVAGYAFILAMHPLSDHHFVFLAVSLAFPQASVWARSQRSEPEAGHGGSLLLVVAAFYAVGVVKDRNEIAGTARRSRRSRSAGRSASSARTRAREQLVVSDLPIVPYLARRQMPGPADRHVHRADRLRGPAPRRGARADPHDTPDRRDHRAHVPDEAAIVAGIRSRYARRLHQPISIGGDVDVFLDRR